MAGFKEYDNYDGLGLAGLVSAGDISAGELLEEVIARVERVNPRLNAVVHTHYDEAREAIANGLPQGPFQGVPFLLKDLYAQLTGTITTNGSAMFEGEVASMDTTLVERYKAAGLVICGKTNSPELGLLPVTEPDCYGPTRNPWDTERTPGGSSGGASAAVAAGIVPIAHASDGGGSIRIPASCTGLVGLKPSRGRVPPGPAKAEGWGGQSINHVVSRTVRDTAAMLDATAGPVPGEPYSAPHQAGSFLEGSERATGELRIALAAEKWGPGSYQPEVRQGLEATAALLESLGHHVEEARPDYDGYELARAIFTVISVNTALSCRQRAEALGVSTDSLPMERLTRRMLDRGMATSGPDYVAAIQCNQAAGMALGRFHADYDLILSPTLSSEPVPVGYLTQSPDDEYNERLLGFMADTGLYNQTGQPSISLPLHWSDAGLPVGMMFSAAYGNDQLLLQVANQLERAQPWSQRRPAVHAGEVA
jgi:amidase/6-aminohexanoate-cyclic-dimer hydrolase